MLMVPVIREKKINTIARGRGKVCVHYPFVDFTEYVYVVSDNNYSYDILSIPCHSSVN